MQKFKHGASGIVGGGTGTSASNSAGSDIDMNMALGVPINRVGI